MLVLTILSLLMAGATMNFSFAKRHHEKAEIRQLEKHLQYIRNLAVSSGKIKTLELNLAADYYILYDDQVSEKVQMDHIDIVSNSSGSNLIRFNYTGAPATATTITLRGKTNQYRITVEVATGKINLKID